MESMPLAVDCAEQFEKVVGILDCSSHRPYVSNPIFQAVQHGRIDARCFCFEKFQTGPTVMIDGEHVHHCTAAKAIEEFNSRIENERPA